MTDTPEPSAALLDRLVTAAGRHDLDALVGCFAPGYRNETPAHPAQGFTGREQVRCNWQQIFAIMPDISVTVLRSCCDGEVVWSEWDMTGTRPDGTPLRMAGVIIFGVRDGLFSWARFYLEPVQVGGPDVSQAVRQRAGAAGAGPGAQP